MSDDVVIRLRLADVAKFVADAKAGRIGLDELEKKIVSVGRVAKAESSNEYGGLGLYGATVGRIKYAVAGLALAAGAGAVALVGFALKSAASLEKVRMGFRQLLGSAGAADQFVSMLQDFAKRTPFNFQDVTTLAQKLLAFGAPAGQVKDDLTAIGNAVSAFGGSSADMDGVITALGQIAMKGHLAGQEVLQLNNHMINAKKYLMDALHVSGSQLDKMERTGKLSSSTVIPIILAGMQHQFGGMMDVQSQTMSGIANNLFDAFQQELVAGVNPFLPAIKAWMQDLLDHMPQIGAALGRIIGGAVALADKAGHFSMSVGAKLSSGDTFGGGQDVGGAIASGLVSAIGNIDWYDAGQSATVKAVGFVFGLVDGLFNWSLWWDLIKRRWVDIILTLSMFIGVGEWAKPLIKVLEHVPILKWFGPPIVRWMESIGKFIGKPFRSLAIAIWHSIEREFPLAATHVGVFFIRIIEWTKGVPGRMKGALLDIGRSILDWIIGGIGRGLGRLWGLVTSLPGAVATFVKSNYAGWATALTAAAGSALASFWDPIKHGFVDAINWVIAKWNSLSSTALGWLFGSAGQVSAMSYPGQAAGGTTTSAGMSWVGERGPELLSMPKGASVIPLPRVPEFAGAGRGGRPIHTHVHLNGREIAVAVHEVSDDMAALR